MAKANPFEIVQGLIDRGYRPHEAAGIAGNLYQESNFDTSIQEINPKTASARAQGGGFGLAQWTSPERKIGLNNMAKSRGLPVDDLGVQLDYIDHELKNTHKKAYAALKGSQDPGQAALAISDHYEIPSPKYANNEKRVGMAQRLLDMINPIGTANADETPWKPQGELPIFTPEQVAAYRQKKQASQPAPELPIFTPEQVAAYRAKKQQPAQPENSTVGAWIDEAGKNLKNQVGGLARGAGSIGNTLLSAGDAYNELVGNKNALSSLDSTHAERGASMDEGLRSMGVDTGSGGFLGGKLVGEIAGTAGAGGVLAKGAAAIPGLSALAPAIESSGIAGKGLMDRIAGGAIAGGAQAGLVNPEDAGIGAVIGGALPPVAKGAFLAGEKIAAPFMGKANAAKEILKQLDGADISNASINIEDKFANIPGIKPTVGMVSDDPNLLKLEMNARVRNKGGKFFQRDAENNVATYRELQKNAIPDLQANEMQGLLNAETGQLREEAFALARSNPVYREQLTKYLDDLAKTPGIRNTEAMPLIERGKRALVMMPENKAVSDVSETIVKDARTPWHKTPIDTEKDNMLAAITKLGGLSKEKAQSTYGNRMWEDVSLGLNTFRNDGGHSLDDMATMLAEKGYLPEGSGVYELTEKLYGNAKDTYSAAKSGYGHIDSPQSAQDQLHGQLSDLIDALNKKNAPRQVAGKTKMVSTAEPEDIYAFRKTLSDKLKLKTITPDELDNAIKASRKLSYDMKKQLDDSLNESSGGAWSRYLKKHSEGMKPIEQGRAFQNILDRFETNKKIFGTDVPQMTPHALRKAVDSETFMNQGTKGWVSRVDEAGRAKLDDAIKVMNAIEQAKGGAVAVNGSPTASFLNSGAEQAMNAATGSRIPSQIMALINSVSKTRGQNVLDDALLNPEKLQSILDIAIKKSNPQPGLISPYLYKSLPVLGAE